MKQEDELQDKIRKELEEKIHRIVCVLGNSTTVVDAKSAAVANNLPFASGKIEGLLDALHYAKMALDQVREETLKECLAALGTIRRFDKKEKDVDFFAGWDSALDTVEIELKELRQ